MGVEAVRWGEMRVKVVWIVAQRVLQRGSGWRWVGWAGVRWGWVVRRRMRGRKRVFMMRGGCFGGGSGGGFGLYRKGSFDRRVREIDERPKLSCLMSWAGKQQVEDHI